LSPRTRELSEDGASASAVVSTNDEFGSLQTGWDDLVRAMGRPSPFLLHGWLAAWCRHYVPDGDLRVHVVRQGNVLLGAFPLYVSRRHGLRVARFLGATQSALADLLVAPDAPADVPERLVQSALASGHDLADLFGLASSGNLASARDVAGLRLIERVEAPVLDLSSGFDAVYQAKTSSKRRNLHKRRLRQLGELGEVRYTVAREPEELRAALENAFVLHNLRWRGRPDGSEFATPTGMRFHREAILALGELDVPRIVTLEVGGRPVAFHYYLAFNGTMYVHRLAFDPALARLSPGVLTTLEALKVASEEGLRRVEFLGGDERYKLELADRIEPLYQGLGMAATPQGRLAVAARLGGIAARKRLKRSPTLRRLYFEGLSPTRRFVSRFRGGGRARHDEPGGASTPETADREHHRASP
jgi:CelD/BcsL family acetyltransferase involved in cellulose biosynthesis